MRLAAGAFTISAALALLFAHATPIAAQSPQLVFATYMTCCPLKGNDQTIDDYINEMQHAQQAGIDGFALDISFWKEDGQRVTNVERLFDAADRLGFKLFIMADQGSAQGGLSVDTVNVLLKRFAHRRSYYHYQGRPFFSTYLGAESWLKRLKSDAIEQGVSPYIVPFLADRTGSTLPRFRETSNLRSLVSEPSLIDGYFSFRIVGSADAQYDIITKLSDTLRAAGKTYMAGVTPYYRRSLPRLTIDDGQGVSKIVSGISAAQAAGANWLQLVTWNDWNESTYLQPFDASQVSSHNGRWKGLLDHGPILKFLKPFISAYKQGTQVHADGDQAVLLYRPSLKQVRCEKDTGDIRLRGLTDANINALQDNIYVAVLLTSTAVIEVKSGGVTKRHNVGSGFHQISVPATPGKVSARVIKNGRPVLVSQNTIPISGTEMVSCFNIFSAELSPPT